MGVLLLSSSSLRVNGSAPIGSWFKNLIWQAIERGVRSTGVHVEAMLIPPFDNHHHHHDSSDTSKAVPAYANE